MPALGSAHGRPLPTYPPRGRTRPQLYKDTAPNRPIFHENSLIFRTFLWGLRNHVGVAGIFLRGLLGTWEGRLSPQERRFGALWFAEISATFAGNPAWPAAGV